MSDVKFENQWLQRLYEVLEWISAVEELSYHYCSMGECEDGTAEEVVHSLVANFPGGDNDVVELAALRDVLMGHKRNPNHPPTCKGCLHRIMKEGPVCKITGDVARISCECYMPGGPMLFLDEWGMP